MTRAKRGPNSEQTQHDEGRGVLPQLSAWVGQVESMVRASCAAGVGKVRWTVPLLSVSLAVIAAVRVW